jgi:colanic acid biosynthesis glycosyl transferase WcaI
MGPIAALWAEEMRRRQHDVSVITAFPHYPPIFQQRWRPYRERRNGVPVLRLPLLTGHETTARRVFEEVSYTACAAIAASAAPRPDAAVVVSPSFLALQPVLRLMQARRVPTLLWLQDILPDAAATTGLLRNRRALDMARFLERTAYQKASRIVVISKTFRQNLIEKGVSPSKIVTIYNPASRGFQRKRNSGNEMRILAMGNIGYSQGLNRFVRAFEDSDVAARLVVIGTGEREDDVRAEIHSNRVEYLGLVDDRRLDQELERATLGLVTQRPDVLEFNVPSKLMTMMARGLPIFAFVRTDSEVERIVRSSGGGWVADCSSPDRVSAVLHRVLADPTELSRRGSAAEAFARREFAVDRVAQRFEELLLNLVVAKWAPHRCLAGRPEP